MLVPSGDMLGLLELGPARISEPAIRSRLCDLPGGLSMLNRNHQPAGSARGRVIPPAADACLLAHRTGLPLVMVRGSPAARGFLEVAGNMSAANLTNPAACFAAEK